MQNHKHIFFTSFKFTPTTNVYAIATDEYKSVFSNKECVLRVAIFAI